MKLRTIVAALTMCFGLSIAGEAQAQTSRNYFQVGNWEGLIHRDRNGNFTHCTMKASYKSGVSLLFAIDDEYEWRIGFLHPSWDFTPGERYPVMYSIDSFAAYRASIKAQTSQLLMTELPSKSKIFEQFRIGQVLTLHAGGTTLSFNLTNTKQALIELLKCAHNNTGN